jgi:hypothetical protein
MLSRSCDAFFANQWTLSLVIAFLLSTYGAAQGVPNSALPPQAALQITKIAAARYGADARWFIDNIPFLVIDDAELEQVYYYRWKVYRSHLREIGAQGVMVTEFLDNVPWGRQPYTDLNDSSSFHLMEGRWLRSPAVVNSLIEHLYAGGGNDRHFSESIAEATLQAVMTTGDVRPALRNLAAMQYVYNQWDDHLDRARNLYWVEPIADATEYTISSIDASGAGFVDTPSTDQNENGFFRGFAFRPTINSYQYANALAIAALSDLDRRPHVAAEYRRRATAIRKAVLEQLWNPAFQHFIDRYQRSTAYVKEGEFIRGRELAGYTPWLYELPPTDVAQYSEAWRHLLKQDELAGPHGLRTVEPSYPRYMSQYRYDSQSKLPECQWNGPSWPFQTSQALTAMANLLDDYQQGIVTPADYLRLLRQYAHQHLAADGHPDLQEDYNPDTGAPIVGLGRSHHYNHSTFNDLILSGLIGIRPRLDDILELKPLLPEDAGIKSFVLDRLVYHGRNIGIVYDADGLRYGLGKGLSVYVEGRRIAGPSPLAPLSVVLPPAPPPVRLGVWPWPADLAVNIGEPTGAQASASSSIAPGSPAEAIDGRLWFFPEIPNGWTPASPKEAGTEQRNESWLVIDFGRDEKVGEVELSFFAHGKEFLPPTHYELQCKSDAQWRVIRDQRRTPTDPLANGINHVFFPGVECSALRLVLQGPAAPAKLRLIELKARAGDGVDQVPGEPSHMK